MPERRPWVQRNRRGPYLESFAIFTKLKTSMQADGDPERGGSRALSHASDGSLGSPMAGRDLSAPRGSSGGGGSGWRRVAAAARESLHLEAAAATPLRSRAACASRSRTIDGRPCRENSMERGRGRRERPGRAPRPVRPGPERRGAPCGGEAWARGAAPAPRAGGAPAPLGGVRPGPGVGGRAGTHARTPRGTAAASQPPSPSRVPAPLPAPTAEGVLSCRSLRVPSDLKDRLQLTDSGTPGPFPPQGKGQPEPPQVAQSLGLFYKQN